MCFPGGVRNTFFGFFTNLELIKYGKCPKMAYIANSVYPDQTAPEGEV